MRVWKTIVCEAEDAEKLDELLVVLRMYNPFFDYDQDWEEVEEDDGMSAVDPDSPMREV